MHADAPQRGAQLQVLTDVRAIAGPPVALLEAAAQLAGAGYSHSLWLAGIFGQRATARCRQGRPTVLICI